MNLKKQYLLIFELTISVEGKLNIGGDSKHCFTGDFLRETVSEGVVTPLLAFKSTSHKEVYAEQPLLL